MKNTNFRLIHLLSVLCFGVGGAVWLTVLLFKYYNAETTAFSAPRGAVLSISLYLFFGVFISAAAGYFSSKKSDDAKIFPKRSYVIPAVFFAASGIIGAVRLFAVLKGSSSALFKIFTVLCVISCFLSALHFVLKSLNSPLSAPTSLVLPLWSAFAIASSYFNPTYTYINFTRVLLNLALAAITLFSLAYARSLLGKDYRILMKISSAAGVVLGVTYMFSRLIFGLSSGSYLTISDAEELAVFGMIVLAVFSFIYSEPKPESPPEEEINE